ncbi:hypothetical protein V2J09_021044, partial [Rumex salicifolius]
SQELTLAQLVERRTVVDKQNISEHFRVNVGEAWKNQPSSLSSIPHSPIHHRFKEEFSQVSRPVAGSYAKCHNGCLVIEHAQKLIHSQCVASNPSSVGKAGDFSRWKVLAGRVFNCMNGALKPTLAQLVERRTKARTDLSSVGRAEDCSWRLTDKSLGRWFETSSKLVTYFKLNL